jgi:PhnB protein
MAKSATPIPPGFHSLSPHLVVNGAVKYMEFLKEAFGATEISRAPGSNGRLMHATARIGDSMLMFSDFFPEYGSQPMVEGNLPLVLHLYVPDADASWAKALAAGCKVTFPLADQFWGSRYGQVLDPFGFKWAIATHMEELTPEEMHQRQAKLFGSTGASA